MSIQLEFDAIGLSESELDAYVQKKRIDEISRQLQNLRRGLFSRHDELQRQIGTQQRQIELLQREIEKLKSFV